MPITNKNCPFAPVMSTVEAWSAPFVNLLAGWSSRIRKSQQCQVISSRALSFLINKCIYFYYIYFVFVFSRHKDVMSMSVSFHENVCCNHSHQISLTLAIINKVLVFFLDFVQKINSISVLKTHFLYFTIKCLDSKQSDYYWFCLFFVFLFF